MYICVCVYLYKIIQNIHVKKALWDGARKSFSCTLSHLELSSKLLDLPEIQCVRLYRQSENYYLLYSFLAVAIVITYAKCNNAWCFSNLSSVCRRALEKFLKYQKK